MQTINKILPGLFLMAISLSSCDEFGFGCIEGNGRIATETRNTGNFERLVSYGSFVIDIIPDSEPALEITADENLISYIKTSIQGNSLVIETQNGRCLRSAEPIRLTVSTGNLEKIKLAGAGLITCRNLETDILDIELPGSGQILVDSLVANELNAELSGSGEISCMKASLKYTYASIPGSGFIELSGVTGTSDFDLSGSGMIRALDLISNTCYADISGSGNIYTSVTETLDISISGSGSLYYKGNPVIRQSITGTGNIRKY